MRQYAWYTSRGTAVSHVSSWYKSEVCLKLVAKWNWLRTRYYFWSKVFLLVSVEQVWLELKVISSMFLFQVADFDFSPLSDKNLSSHSEPGCGQICCRSCFLQSSQETARESHELLLSFYKPVKMYTVWRTQLHFGYTNSKFNFLTYGELQAQCCMNDLFLPMWWG